MFQLIIPIQSSFQFPGDASEKIVLVETNTMCPLSEYGAAETDNEKGKHLRSLLDYSASDFIKVDEAGPETKLSETRLKNEKFRSYTEEPDFITEMWKTPKGTTARLTSLKEIFRRKKYARFTIEDSKDLAMDEILRVETEQGSRAGGNEPALTPQKKSFCGKSEVENDVAPETAHNSNVKVKTKILARRSQRPNHEKDAENLSNCRTRSSVFNEFSQIEASISFAAHVRRQGPGFSASCTQTLRTCDFTSVGDLFESEVQSNVTFNPLFEDDDSDDDRPVGPRRYRLYTIDEESEAYDSGS